MLLPRRCPCCGALGAAPCAACARELRPAPRLPPVPGCASVAACHRYEGTARRLLLACKYRNRRDPVAAFAASLAALVPPGADLVTWAPTSRARARARGYDQAEVLARALGRATGLPVRATLRRTGGAPQTGRPAHERREGPRLALRGGRAARAVRGATVVLVDDVVTTGATFAHAAAVLGAAGAAAVHARAVAATPAPAGGPRRFGTSVPGSPHGGVPS